MADPNTITLADHNAKVAELQLTLKDAESKLEAANKRLSELEAAETVRLTAEKAKRIDTAFVPYEMMQAAREAWDEAIDLGQKYGFRNGQTTVLAPTGTIAFLMDCDTTGVEPDIALVKYKKLVGGGTLKIVNQAVPAALARLGYQQEQVGAISQFIDQHDTIEGAPGMCLPT